MLHICAERSLGVADCSNRSSVPEVAATDVYVCVYVRVCFVGNMLPHLDPGLTLDFVCVLCL